MDSLELSKIEALKNIILEWFYKNRENYSFRNNRTPYRVWISETILQQTRMSAALEKMENFFLHFPDLNSLAAAREEEVLFAFKGLGYYNRARNLLKGAKYVVSKYKDIPSEYNQLIEIPSIGPYTASAIASICFGKLTPVIDGNIKRIFARIFQIEIEIKNSLFLSQLNLILLKMFNFNILNPGDLNEALMEFGQKICKVKNPQCLTCFVQKYCLAYKNSSVNKLPFITRPENKIIVNWKLYFFINNRKVLLNQFNDFYLLKNHIGFPSIIEMYDEKFFSTHGDIYNNFLSNYKLHNFVNGDKHTITNHQIRFSYCIYDLKNIEINGEDLFWCPFENVENFLVSSGLNKTWSSVYDQIFARGGT